MPGPTVLSMGRSQFRKLPVPDTDYTGQTILITGGNTGIGLEAARHFVRLGAARVIISTRSLSKGEAAKKDIGISTNKTGVVEVWELDLTQTESVRSFAARANTELDKLDCAVLSAGLNTHVFQLAEGRELHLTVNVVNTILLAILLLPKLRSSSPADTALRRPHLVIVTSEVHTFCRFKDWENDDILASSTEKAKKSIVMQYPASKLMGLLLARELATRIPPSSVIINTVNPGLCKSELLRDGNAIVRFGKRIAFSLFARTTEVGSRTYMSAAALGEVSHGAYVSDCKVAETSGFVTSKKGLAAQRRLWEQVVLKLQTASPEISEILDSNAS